MEFNEHWTKSDNDLMRQMIKEHKSSTEIINFFGRDKLKYHPKKKFIGRGGLPNFDIINQQIRSKKINKLQEICRLKKYGEYIKEEIKIHPKYTTYDLKRKFSDEYPTKYDYLAEFKTDSQTDYMLNLTYIEDNISPFPNQPMYNISFTTKEQYNTNEYENETHKNEVIEVMKRIVYILLDINDLIIRRYFPNPIYILGETDNPQKINFYRNIMKDSLPNYEEIKGKSSINDGKDAYYFYLK
jgi:hypothetical protein